LAIFSSHHEIVGHCVKKPLYGIGSRRLFAERAAEQRASNADSSVTISAE
jgi:hypothetical protein